MAVHTRIFRSVALLLAAASVASLLLPRCAIPDDPSNNPENVKLSILPESGNRDSLSIGDSLRLEVAVIYPHLVDSLQVKLGDSLLLTLLQIHDTARISLLPHQPGLVLLTITGYCRDGVVAGATDTFFIKGIPVRVVAEPHDTAIPEGATAIFAIVASGNPFPAIQWYRDSIVISGETNDSLRIDSVTTAMNGWSYRARLTNSVDTVWSAPSVLTVIAAAPRWDMLRWDSVVWW